MLISIVVPVYNAGRYLDKTIHSIQNQTYEEWELLLIDDGSTDDSGIICDKYAGQDKRITAWHKPNQGVSATRNIGIQESKGEWIVFVDADDILEKEYLNLMVSKANDVQLVCCSLKSFPDSKFEKLTETTKTFDVIQETAQEFQWLYQNGFYNSPCNKLYRRSLITWEFATNCSLGEDLLFNIQYFKKCRGIRVLPEQLYCYRYDLSQETLSKKFNKAAVLIELEIYQNMKELFAEDESVEKTLTEHLVDNIIAYFRRVMAEKNKSEEEKIKIIEEWLSQLSSLKKVRIDVSSIGFVKWLAWKIIMIKQARIVCGAFRLFNRLRPV